MPLGPNSDLKEEANFCYLKIIRLMKELKQRVVIWLHGFVPL